MGTLDATPKEFCDIDKFVEDSQFKEVQRSRFTFRKANKNAIYVKAKKGNVYVRSRRTVSRFQKLEARANFGAERPSTAMNGLETCLDSVLYLVVAFTLIFFFSRDNNVIYNVYIAIVPQRDRNEPIA